MYFKKKENMLQDKSNDSAKAYYKHTYIMSKPDHPST